MGDAAKRVVRNVRVALPAFTLCVASTPDQRRVLVLVKRIGLLYMISLLAFAFVPWRAMSADVDIAVPAADDAERGKRQPPWGWAQREYGWLGADWAIGLGQWRNATATAAATSTSDRWDVGRRIQVRLLCIGLRMDTAQQGG